MVEIESERELHKQALGIKRVYVVDFSIIDGFFILQLVATLIPATPLIFVPSPRKEAWLHTLQNINLIVVTYIFKQASAFCEISDDQLYTTRKINSISHAKGKPLQTPTRVCVTPHKQVVFFVADASDLVNVCTLKIGVEPNQVLVLGPLDLYLTRVVVVIGLHRHEARVFQSVRSRL